MQPTTPKQSRSRSLTDEQSKSPPGGDNETRAFGNSRQMLEYTKAFPELMDSNSLFFTAKGALSFSRRDVGRGGQHP